MPSAGQRRLLRLHAQLSPPSAPPAPPIAAPLPAGGGAGQPLRVGIIGLGDITEKSFAPSVLACPNATLVAVCRRDLAQAKDFAARWTEQQGGGPITVHGTAEELCADPTVDAVIVATTTTTHEEYTVLAASHGKHIL